MRNCHYHHTRNSLLTFCVFSVLLIFDVASGFQQFEYCNTTEIENDFDSKARFDDSQLWRIYNASNRMFEDETLVEVMEQRFNGTAWKEAENFLDISVGKSCLANANQFLARNLLTKDVLHDNIQELIDAEELEEANAVTVAEGTRVKKATKSGMNWSRYHDYSVIMDFLDEMRAKYPKIVKIFTIGRTAQGRRLRVLRITESFSRNKQIWIDGGIHAREWISPATVTYIIRELLSNWSTLPRSLKQKTWYIMPVMNPDGYVYSRKSNRMWRKNRRTNKGSNCRGVDLNRNFDINWRGTGTSKKPCSDIYGGPKPHSERETKAVARFLRNHKRKLSAYLTYHSYGQVIVYPWGYKRASVRDGSKLKRVANTAIKRIKAKTKKTYRTGPTAMVISPASGGSDDWSRAKCNIKYVYTVELRDRGRYGFILPAKQIKNTAIEGFIIATTVGRAIRS